MHAHPHARMQTHDGAGVHFGSHSSCLGRPFRSSSVWQICCMRRWNASNARSENTRLWCPLNWARRRASASSRLRNSASTYSKPAFSGGHARCSVGESVHWLVVKRSRVGCRKQKQQWRGGQTLTNSRAHKRTSIHDRVFSYHFLGPLAPPFPACFDCFFRFFALPDDPAAAAPPDVAPAAPAAPAAVCLYLFEQSAHKLLHARSRKRARTPAKHARTHTCTHALVFGLFHCFRFILAAFFFALILAASTRSRSFSMYMAC